MSMILSVMTSLGLSSLLSKAEPSFRRVRQGRRSGPRHVSLDTSFHHTLKHDV